MDPAVEGWREILQPQALDLVLFAAFIALALVSFFRKSVALKYVTFVAAVGYLGFTKSSLVSVSDVFRLTDLSVPEFKYSLAWYAFMLFVVATTVLWGRVYCGRVCAFGALTQLMDPIIPRKMRIEIPVRTREVRQPGQVRRARRRARVLPRHQGCRRTDPLCRAVLDVQPVRHHRDVDRPGAAAGRDGLRPQPLLPLSLPGRRGARHDLQRTTVFRIKRWSECKTCKICEKTCEWGAIRGPQIVKSECVRCDDCERLYLDQKKCPHWLILFKRRGNTAVPVPHL